MNLQTDLAELCLNIGRLKQEVETLRAENKELKIKNELYLSYLLETIKPKNNETRKQICVPGETPDNIPANIQTIFSPTPQL